MPRLAGPSGSPRVPPHLSWRTTDYPRRHCPLHQHVSSSACRAEPFHRDTSPNGEARPARNLSSRPAVSRCTPSRRLYTYTVTYVSCTLGVPFIRVEGWGACCCAAPNKATRKSSLLQTTNTLSAHRSWVLQQASAGYMSWASNIHGNLFREPSNTHLHLRIRFDSDEGPVRPAFLALLLPHHQKPAWCVRSSPQDISANLTEQKTTHTTITARGPGDPANTAATVTACPSPPEPGGCRIPHHPSSRQSKAFRLHPTEGNVAFQPACSPHHHRHPPPPFIGDGLNFLVQQ